MTHYAVRDGLSFCRVDGRFVFLDVDNDRYFRLPDSLDQALASHLQANGTSDPDIGALIKQNILVDQPGRVIDDRPSIRPAVRSAMETPLTIRKLRPFDLLEVFSVVLRTRVALKLSPLKTVLADLGPERLFQPAQAAQLAAELDRRLSDAVAVYRRARLYVPVGMCCLLDSVALKRFLRKRRLHAHLVFGVAIDPFSAHCWVQAGDLVLNDTVGNVHSHTPIRVV